MVSGGTVVDPCTDCLFNIEHMESSLLRWDVTQLRCLKKPPLTRFKVAVRPSPPSLTAPRTAGAISLNG
jgi:hypothetical protein